MKRVIQSSLVVVVTLFAAACSANSENSSAENKPENSVVANKPENSSAENNPENSAAGNKPENSVAGNKPDIAILGTWKEINGEYPAVIAFFDNGLVSAWHGGYQLGTFTSNVKDDGRLVINALDRDDKPVDPWYVTISGTELSIAVGKERTSRYTRY